MSTIGPADAHAALGRLADALDRSEFTTVLTWGTRRRPRLTVEYRRTRAIEDIYADGWFWWSWAERIAPADDPQVTVYCAVQNPTEGGYYGSQVCGPVFRQVMEFSLKALHVAPSGEDAVTLPTTFDPDE